MITVLHKSTNFILTQEYHRKQKHGSPFYRIKYYTARLHSDLEEIRDLIDPDRNIAGTKAFQWRFKDRKIAEKKYTLLMLRWS